VRGRPTTPGAWVSDFAGDGVRLQSFRRRQASGEEVELKTVAPLAAEVELIRIRRNRSINQQFAVYSQFATMSHDKATVTHRRKGR
jgi:hypothetical protein